jgi:hypothetical protein
LPQGTSPISNPLLSNLSLRAATPIKRLWKLDMHPQPHERPARKSCACLTSRKQSPVPRAAANNVGKIDTPLHEMSVEELKTLAARLENELAERATDVSGATLVPVGPLVADLLG